MNLLRLLIPVLLAWLAWLWLKKKLRPPPTAGGGAPTPMRQCRHCGVYVPASDALREGENWYCCEEHRHAGE